jgi:hypothetical protein
MQTQNVPNTNLDLYNYSNSLGKVSVCFIPEDSRPSRWNVNISRYDCTRNGNMTFKLAFH